MFHRLEQMLQRMRDRKGQGSLEFAFVFPFFVLMIFGIMYFGFLFADYSTLNDIARSTARAASISSQPDDTIRKTQLQQTGNMPSEALGEPIFNFVKDGTLQGGQYDITRADHNVTVTISAPINDNALLAKMFKTFLNFHWSNPGGKTADLPFKDGLSVTYTMYDENATSSSSSKTN